jgi:hypothetical protein
MNPNQNKLQEKIHNALNPPGKTHVDDWLAAISVTEEPATVNYARFVLNYMSLSASTQRHYRLWMAKYRLYALYNGQWFEVTGCSRFGDIWLQNLQHEALERPSGYVHRVYVDDVVQWDDHPPHLV